jgi:hypothetical protein
MNSTLSDLDKLHQKTLSILTERTALGAQSFVVNGDFDRLISFQLSEGQLTDAAKAARQQLRDIHITETKTLFGIKQVKNKFDDRNAKSKADFIADLRQMAPFGYHLWTALFQTQPEFKNYIRDELPT